MMEGMRRGILVGLSLWGLGLAQTHIVAPGDTLYSLARRYGTTVEALMRLNGLQDTVIKVGQVLKVPSGETAQEALDPQHPLLQAVVRRLGLAYRYGANAPSEVDCSAFVVQVYAELGLSLPRTTKELWAALPEAGGLLPGDLVFFSFGGKEVDHVGIYLGRGVFAHANSYGGRVVIESLEAPPYQRSYRGARRAVPGGPEATRRTPGPGDGGKGPSGP